MISIGANFSTLALVPDEPWIGRLIHVATARRLELQANKLDCDGRGLDYNL